MNRFVKKNMMLLTMLVITAVAAIGLLVYAAVVVVELGSSMKKTTGFRDEIKKLNQANLTPNAENELAIAKDKEIYEKANQALLDGFRNPFDAPIENFVKRLPAPVYSEIIPEDKREELKDGKVMRKLNADELKRLAAACFEAQYPDEEKRAAGMDEFINGFKKNFSNWDSAVSRQNSAFRKVAKDFDSADGKLLLYSTLGIGNSEKLTEFQEKYSEQLPVAAAEFVKVIGAPKYFDGFPEELREEFCDPKVLKKLTVAEFRELFKVCFELQYPDENERRRNTSLNSFIDSFKTLFKNSWDEAFKGFIADIQTVTNEPVTAANDQALFMYALGGERIVPETVPQFQAHMVIYQDKLRRLAKNETGEASGKEEDPNEHTLSVDKALSFMLGSTRDNENSASGISVGNNRLDMQDVLFHWDVFGFMIPLLREAKIYELRDIRLRQFSDPEEGRRFGAFADPDAPGGFVSYHYTLELTGTMDNIRKFCSMLDTSYKNKRMFIVRAVTLYSMVNPAAEMMGQTVGQADSEASGEREELSARQQRLKAREGAEGNEETAGDENDPSKKVPEVPKEYYLRDGYGRKAIGRDKDCHVFIDVDYFVRAKE